MSLVTSYLFMAIVASACSILILIFSSKFLTKAASIKAASLHKMSRLICVLLILSPLAYYAAPVETLTIVSTQSAENGVSVISARTSSMIEQATPYENSNSLPSSLFLVRLLSLSFLFFLAKYYTDQLKIRQILNKSYLLRSIGKVRILLSDTAGVPFAYRDMKNSYIVIPNYMTENSTHFSLAIKHEIQHHRQGDTSWSHLSFFIKALFFWNPLVHFAEKRISEIQELACDEALIDRKRIDANEYCDCLVSVAESAINPYKILAGTTTMAQSASAHNLKWRIEMIRRKDFTSSRWLNLLVGTISLSVVSSVAFASSELIRDKEITLIEAESLIKNSGNDGFPIEVNEAVLSQLNYYIGTQEGRDFIRESLKRQSQHEDVLQEKLDLYNAPNELLAVALMESGFNNSPQNPDAFRSAGVWQFTPGTARSYGLKIDDVVDERLDVELATDAAMQLLQNLNSRFNDWRLAIIGYNAGRNKVQRGIDKTGSHDPWVLIEAGYDGDQDYLAKMMAGVIILKNPTLID